MKTDQAQSPSASPQSNAPPPPVFPEDVIVEILSWLPVKSILQFRFVCKWWKSIISYPNFVKLHLRRSARNVNLLLLWERDPHNFRRVYLNAVTCSVRSLLGNSSSTFDKDDCYPLSNNCRYPVVGSCNGLVCLFGPIFRNNYLESWFYLWNPASKLASKYFAGLHANSFDSVYRFAFGYDNLNDTYKVLAFRFDGKAKEESQKIPVKIYSFGDNCWRNIQSFPVIPFDDRRNIGVYFQGTFNWLASFNDNNSNDYKWNNTITIAQMLIISLDLGMETYTQLLLPCLDEAHLFGPTIGVLMDCLCFSYDSMGTHFVLWQMKEFGVERSWTQFMKVSYQCLQIDMEFSCPLLPLCMSEKGDVLIMAANDKLQAIMYHWRDNRVERTELPNYIQWSSTMDYVESLVSPCCNLSSSADPPPYLQGHRASSRVYGGMVERKKE